jgi:ParB family chromosome partitioning protein
MGHARALLSLDRATQITAADQIAAKMSCARTKPGAGEKLGAEFSPQPQKVSKESP